MSLYHLFWIRQHLIIKSSFLQFNNFVHKFTYHVVLLNLDSVTTPRYITALTYPHHLLQLCCNARYLHFRGDFYNRPTRAVYCCNCHVINKHKTIVFCIFLSILGFLNKEQFKRTILSKRSLRAQCGLRELLHRSRKHPVCYTETRWLTWWLNSRSIKIFLLKYLIVQNYSKNDIHVYDTGITNNGDSHLLDFSPPFRKPQLLSMHIDSRLI